MARSLGFCLILALFTFASCADPAPDEKPETPAAREARIDRAIDKNPKDPWPYFERGQIEEARGDLWKALDDYGACVSLLPARHATRPALSLGRVHWKLGHAEPARRMLEEVVTTVPSDNKFYVANPDFREAALLLRDVYTAQKDEKAVEKMRARFLEEFGGKPEDWDKRS
jgi:tetratricopeptide (TPR) repeat protein